MFSQLVSTFIGGFAGQIASNFWNRQKIELPTMRIPHADLLTHSKYQPHQHTQKHEYANLNALFASLIEDQPAFAVSSL